MAVAPAAAAVARLHQRNNSLCPGDTAAFNAALKAFSQIRSPVLELTLTSGTTANLEITGQ